MKAPPFGPAVTPRANAAAVLRMILALAASSTAAFPAQAESTVTIYGSTDAR